MLAHPTEAGAHCPGFVHRWLNIDTDFTVSVRPALFDERKQTPKFLADDFVVVIAPGVTRNLSGPWVRSRPDCSCSFVVMQISSRDDCVPRAMLMRRKVIERNYDD